MLMVLTVCFQAANFTALRSWHGRAASASPHRADSTVSDSVAGDLSSVTQDLADEHAIEIDEQSAIDTPRGKDVFRQMRK